VYRWESLPDGDANVCDERLVNAPFGLLPDRLSNVALTLQNPAFRAYALSSALLVSKMVLLQLGTTTLRLMFRVVNKNNREDVTTLSTIVEMVVPRPASLNKEDSRAKFEASVERVRRCHLNDLENILQFMTIGIIYVLLGLGNAPTLFYAFTAARFAHSLFYAVLGVQPWRAIAWTVGLIIQIYMLLQIILLTR